MNIKVKKSICEKELNTLYIRWTELNQQRSAEKSILKRDKIDVQIRRCERKLDKITCHLEKINSLQAEIKPVLTNIPAHAGNRKIS